MKLWKSKKSATSSCVSAVSGKLNLSGNKNGYKDDDQSETNSSAQATPTSQSTIHLANGLHQGEKMMSDTFMFHRCATEIQKFQRKKIFLVRLCCFGEFEFSSGRHSIAHRETQFAKTKSYAWRTIV